MAEVRETNAKSATFGFLGPLSEAIESGCLSDAIKFLETCSAGSLGHLAAHRIGGLPALHYLACQRFCSENCHILEQLVQYYVQNGYDINQRTDEYRAQKRVSFGFTALLAAVERSNNLYLHCLIKLGADPNVRDSGEFSACHWAILVGNLKCLTTLIEGGASVRSTEGEISGDCVHPILHTAVDEGRTEIVFDLLQRSETDFNEEAIYRGMLSEKSFTNFPSRYNCFGGATGAGGNGKSSSLLETEDIKCTPLARAVRMRKIPIIEMLLKHDAKLSGFSELHFCILEGDTEVACLLISYFTDKDLQNDKIEDQWALHCLHSVAFEDELRIDKTIKLIMEYLDAGWDVNSFSADITRKVAVDTNFADKSISEEESMQVIVGGCTLLHVACLFRSHRIIHYLVDQEKADVNVRTGSLGNIQLLPLQILILLKSWDSAEIVTKNNANLGIAGAFKNQSFSCIKRKYNLSYLQDLDNTVEETDISGSRADVTYRCFNSVELLLKLGYPEGQRLLEVMLDKFDVGTNELFISVEGGNPLFVTTVFKLLPKKDEKWQQICLHPYAVWRTRWIPTLTWLLINSVRSQSPHIKTKSDISTLASLMKDFVFYGYDCNVSVIGKRVGGDETKRLIFHILRIDFKYRTSELLKTLLEFGHVSLNAVDDCGRTPIEYILHLWDAQCLSGTETNNYCWKAKDQENYCSRTIELLLNHGADASNLKFDGNIKYHFGYNNITRLLFQAGANIKSNIFEAGVCHPGFASTKQFLEEIQGLHQYLQDNKNNISLKHFSRVAVRKLLNNVGDLKQLDVLPRALKAEVLCKCLL